MHHRHTSGTYHSLKISYRIALSLITAVIAFLLIIERVHGENKTECDPDAQFICEKVITNISNCEKSSCPTIGVKMVKKCDTRYKDDQSIKRKCEEWPTSENQMQNHFLTLPVINKKKGIAYWNMYCALCNYEDEFKFEDPVLLPATVERCKLSMFLNFNFALNESIKSKCTDALCYGHTSRIIREDLLKSDYHCNQTPSYTELHDRFHLNLNKYCNNDSSLNCPKLPFRNDLICSYRSDVGKYCEYDWFLFEGINFAYGENGNIYVPSYYKNKFLHDEYTNLTGNKGVIYVCGQEYSRVYVPLKILIILSYSVSIVFLMLCVILNTNEQSLRNLPNRTLYSFCITQLIYSLFRLDAEFPAFYGTCIAAHFMYGFIAFSSTLWNVVVFFEYGRIIYFLIRNQELSDEVEMKKYLFYCFLCWIIPAILTVFPFFFISMFGEKSSCPRIKDYSLVYCGFDRKSHNYAGLLFEVLVENHKICIRILALGAIVVILAIVYLSRQYIIGYNERNYSTTFKKTSVVCIIMSFQFVFSWLEQFSESAADGLFDVIFEICDGFLGVSIFFAYYYEKDTVSNLLAMFNLRKTSSPENIEILEQEWDDVSHFSRE